MNPADIACHHYPSFLTPTRVISKRFENLVSALATSSPGLFRITSRAREVRIPATRIQRRVLESRHRFAAFSAFEAAKLPIMRVAVVQAHIKIFLSLRLLGVIWAPQPHRAFRAAIFAAWAVTCTFHFNCRCREERIVIYRIHDST
jgi:hypothetical protein